MNPRSSSLPILAATIVGLGILPTPTSARQGGQKNGAGQAIGGRRPDEGAPTLGEPLETRLAAGRGQVPAFPGQTRAVAVATKTPLDVRVFASGLDHPWSFAFLPDGPVLVTEKPGKMRIVGKDGKVGEPIEGVPPVVYDGDAGLLDVVLDPRFSTNRTIYFTYVEPREGGSGLAVAKATLSKDEKRLEGLKIILDVMPTVRPTAHYGSRLLFDKKGYLFVSVGERFFPPTRPQAQALDSTMGKILRITTEGKAAPGNPFEGRPGALPEIWSYGHRNPQCLTFDPRTGEMWDIEHGPQGGDEVNHIRPGHNYGWPAIAYGTEYDGSPVSGTGKTQADGMDQPVYYWDPAIGPTGGTFYDGGLIPEWKGNLFAAGHNGEHVARLVLDGERVVGEERLLLDQHQKMREVRQGPDGALWVCTDDPNGRLIRISPKR